MPKLMTYSVYIMSNKHHTVFYIGVTSNLEVRIREHKSGESKFTTAYNIDQLLYYEDYSQIKNAIAREKQLKKWKREWKIELIQKENPLMKDLAADWEAS